MEETKTIQYCSPEVVDFKWMAVLGDCTNNGSDPGAYCTSNGGIATQACDYNGSGAVGGCASNGASATTCGNGAGTGTGG